MLFKEINKIISAMKCECLNINCMYKTNKYTYGIF